MNLRALLDSFRVDSDDVAKPYLWADAEVIRWFNEAQDEASIRMKLLFDKTSPFTRLNIGPQTGSVYKLNSKICEIVYVTYKNSAGEVRQLQIKDRIELDRTDPDWRINKRRPENVIHRDNTLEFDCILDANYTVQLETHRLPLNCMANDSDCPEIHEIHHRFLVHWVLHRAYMKPDAETLNPNKSQMALQDFEDYFGKRPDADLRKDQNANRPHRNKAYW